MLRLSRKGERETIMKISRGKIKQADRFTYLCKTTIYEVYFKKILLYGAETWTCTKREESKIQATEIKFLTAIMGKTDRDRMRNTHVTEELRMEDI
jgi:hypothetical protein